MVLASMNDYVPLDKLAQLANRIFEVTVPQTVSAVQSANLGNELDKLKSEVAGLKKLIKSLPSQCNSCPHSPSPAPENNINNPGICWYHQNMDRQFTSVNLFVQGIVCQELSPSLTFFDDQPTNEFEAKFPDVTQPQCGNNPIKHDVTDHITTTGPPVSAHS